MDLLCNRRHDWRHYGSRPQRGDTPQRIVGRRLSYGFLQCPLGLHAQFILVQRSGRDEEELHGRFNCNHLWSVVPSLSGRSVNAAKPID